MNNRRQSGGEPLYYYQTKDNSFPERLAARLGARREVPVPTFRERLEWHPYDQRFEQLSQQGLLHQERGGFLDVPPEAWEDYVTYQWSPDEEEATQAIRRVQEKRRNWMAEPATPLTPNQRRQMLLHWPPPQPPHPATLVPPDRPLTLGQVAPGIDVRGEPFQFEDVPEEPAPRRRKQ